MIERSHLVNERLIFCCILSVLLSLFIFVVETNGYAFDVNDGSLFGVTGAIDSDRVDDLLNAKVVDLTNDAFADPGRIFVFAESQQLLLNNSLSVDWLRDVDQTAVTYGGPTQPIGGLIPASAVITSHILHFDTEQMQPATLTGTATFNSEILGVILDSGKLNASDSEIGISGIGYPTSGGRGWEIGGKTGTFSISADGRTICVVGLVEEQLDQMRIITASSLGTVEFVNDQTIDVDNFDFECFDIVVRNGSTLTINGLHQFNSLSIIEGSQVRHAGGSFMDLDISSDVSVAANSRINTNGRGFLGGEGPGSGGAGVNAGGGGHGGQGGFGDQGSGGDVYGSFSQPATMGSGGGNSSQGCIGGSGGGVIRMTIGGTLIVDGEIEANGGAGQTDGVSCNAGGGSGGSIWIETEFLEGIGSIEAFGGSSPGNAGGGAGGRIAVYVQSSNFDDSQFNTQTGDQQRPGGCGTIYFQESAGQQPRLIIDNQGIYGQNAEFSGDVILPGDLIVRSNGRIGPPRGDDSLHLQVGGDVLVEVSGQIRATGRGFLGGEGPGSGGAGVNAGGGGHGGQGGFGDQGSGGDVYGSFSQPATMGSGGGNSSQGCIGGSGGGVIRMTIGGTLIVDGEIEANGGAGQTDGVSCNAGGGSGGSIWIETEFLEGIGSIEAFGGSSPGNAGGGAGGRIAVYAQSSNFDDSQFNTQTGDQQRPGGCGTIYFQESAGQQPRLIIDNQGIYGQNAEFSGDVILPGDLIVRSNGRIGPPRGDDSLHLQVGGDVLVEVSGQIRATGRGFLGGEGPGSGGAGVNAGGGGHGGQGGFGDQGSGGDVYGSFSQPATMGSGGGNSSQGCIGGSGGGVIRMTIGGTLIVDGEIEANGGAGQTDGVSCNAGGGSGGSIWIETEFLEGIGSIEAFGGSSPGNAGGGAGGRIAVYAQSSNFDDSQFNTQTGDQQRPGGCGTIYFQESAGQQPRLIIDNQGIYGQNAEFSGDVILPGDLIVRSNGRIGPPRGDDSLHLQVGGDVLVEVSGQVFADGRGFSGGLGPGAGGGGTNAGGGGYWGCRRQW